MDKAAYNAGSAEKYSNESPPEVDPTRVVEEKGIRLGEAADMYGDLGAAEEYGYVSRGLKSRHIQFIALGGTIGTGLFLGIGRAFTQAGPLSILLGYTFTGIAIFAMVTSLPQALEGFCTNASHIDDVSRRNGNMAPVTGRYSPVLRSLRGWCNGFCCRLE